MPPDFQSITSALSLSSSIVRTSSLVRSQAPLVNLSTTFQSRSKQRSSSMVVSPLRKSLRRILRRGSTPASSLWAFPPWRRYFSASAWSMVPRAMAAGVSSVWPQESQTWGSPQVPPIFPAKQEAHSFWTI